MFNHTCNIFIILLLFTTKWFFLTLWPSTTKAGWANKETLSFTYSVTVLPEACWHYISNDPLDCSVLTPPSERRQYASHLQDSSLPCFQGTILLFHTQITHTHSEWNLWCNRGASLWLVNGPSRTEMSS